MPSESSDAPQPVGNLALARFANVPASFLRRITWAAGTREREIVQESRGFARVERTLPLVYLPDPSQGILGHVAFALKHESAHLGILANVFARLTAADVATYAEASPTGAYARRIGYLYELLTGTELPLHNPEAIAGNYVPLLDSAKMVTGLPKRSARWKVEDNLLGDRVYSPTIERTPQAQSALATDWSAKVRAAVAPSRHPELLRRALQYLFRKETKSSFAIERETPSEARATRFVTALEQAGQGGVEASLAEEHLSAIQRTIVDPRFAAKSFRTSQNYVGGMEGWELVIHYVSPPPALVPEFMAGLLKSASRLRESDPLAQAALASFGFVFHHPFDDGNGRLHRYLIHDILVRRQVVPGGMALPISAAILEDLSAYDRALEAYSRRVAEIVRYDLSTSGELTVANLAESAWVWRYPDLTPQVEFLAKIMERAIAMVPEELEFLSRYDRLVRAVKEIVELPDPRLNLLFSLIRANGGTLSNNKRKQSFTELTEQEIEGIESAYREIFGPAQGQASQTEGRVS
jgi:hypothetical protein